MVVIMIQQQQQQQNTALASHPINPSSSTTTTTTTTTASTASLRSPTVTPTQPQLPSPLSLAPLSSHRHQTPLASGDHAIRPLPIAVANPEQQTTVTTMACQLARVRLSEIAPFDGAPVGNYVRAVEALSGSLMRHNAAVIELGCDDAALMRCGLEASRLYFRSRAQQGVGKGSRGVYMYRAGR